jgi:hypothetical protein
MTGTYKYRYVKINLTDDETAPILSIEKSTSAELTVEPDLGFADIKTFSVEEGSIGFTLDLEFQWVSETSEGGYAIWFNLQQDRGDGTYVDTKDFTPEGIGGAEILEGTSMGSISSRRIFMSSVKLQVDNHID